MADALTVLESIPTAPGGDTEKDIRALYAALQELTGLLRYTLRQLEREDGDE